VTPTRPFLLAVVVASSLLATVFTPPAAASAAGCASFSSAAPIPAGVAVPSAYPSTLGAACWAGLSFSSLTGACPLNVVGPVALPGQYCGTIPGFAPSMTVTCTGVAGPNTTFTAIVVGLDAAPWDGNIDFTEPLVYNGVNAAFMRTASITNQGPMPARVIAYPVGVVGPGPIIVDCAGVASVPVNPQFPPGACGSFGANLQYAKCDNTLPHGAGCSGIYDEISSGTFFGGAATPYVKVCDPPGTGGESVCVGVIREPPGRWDETCLEPLGPCKLYQRGGAVDYRSATGVRTDALGGESIRHDREFKDDTYVCRV
jgi:hypothetical protein